MNLIGEHIDYHNLPVLPMAIQRGIRVAWTARAGARISARSRQFGQREFEWLSRLEPSSAGDWENYVKAAAQAVAERWGVGRGIDAEVDSDLPAAAGLSSSSALLTAFMIALLRANGVEPRFEELMAVLPEAEHFVGTRGGGMDHAAVLAGEPGAAVLVRFAPVGVQAVPVPPDWAFLAVHSMVVAEKSGAVRAEYNRRRMAGVRAFEKAGREPLEDEEQRAYLHVTAEARRVESAVEALRSADADRFGEALNASHESLRDLLRVSCPALDELVAIARQAGAIGARLTGAGFGGFAIVACRRQERDRIAARIRREYFEGRPGFQPDSHLIAVEPSAGALKVPKTSL